MKAAINLPKRIVDAISYVIGAGPASLHEPSFCGNEWQYLKECLDSTFVSSVGKFVDRFESELAQFTGAKHAVAVVEAELRANDLNYCEGYGLAHFRFLKFHD